VQRTIVSSFAWIDRQDRTVTGSWKSLNVNQLLYCKRKKESFNVFHISGNFYTYNISNIEVAAANSAMVSMLRHT
jgi:hypothetical protein